MVENLDTQIGRLITLLKETDKLENTFIIFISDNGGSPLTGANNSPLSAGKYSLWEGGIRVPMAIIWPGKVQPGKVEKNYVSATDILPTLSMAAGLDLDDPTIDGISLLQPKEDRLLVWKWGNTWAVRKRKWKLTNTNEEWGKGRPSNYYIKPVSNDLSLKLFNLEKDPGERQNQAEMYPEVVNELRSDFESWVKENTGKY